MVEAYEGMLLDRKGNVTLSQLSEICVTEESVIIQMAEYGIVEPRGEEPQNWVFTHSAIVRSQKALRLHRDLAINWAGISLALELLDELQELRQRVSVFEKEN